MIDFVNLLENDEVENLVSKLKAYRELCGREYTDEDILVLVSWARAIRRNDRLLNLILLGDMLIDVNKETKEVTIVKQI